MTQGTDKDVHDWYVQNSSFLAPRKPVDRRKWNVWGELKR